MQVNAGANAVRILQRLMAAFGLPLKDDGVIGPVTARTVAQAMELAPDHLVDAYGIARRNYYYRLGDQRPSSRKYARAQGRRQGRLDRPRRGVHLGPLPPHPGGARREGRGMGLIGNILGAGAAARQIGEAVGGVAEVFVGNRAERDARPAQRSPPRSASSAPSSPRRAPAASTASSTALNRLPRPLLALGTLGLFVYAMAEPAGFSPGCRASASSPSRSGGCSAPSSPSTSAPASSTTSAAAPVRRRPEPRLPPAAAGSPCRSPPPRRGPPLPAIDPDYNAAVEEWRRLRA